MPPHAIHGTVLDRRWHAIDASTIAIDLGPDWPFAEPSAIPANLRNNLIALVSSSIRSTVAVVIGSLL